MKQPSEKMWEKQKIQGNNQFLLLPRSFLHFLSQISISLAHLFCHFLMLSIKQTHNCRLNSVIWLYNGLKAIMIQNRDLESNIDLP